ncbi:MAG: hypothetical protein J0I42_02315 [Bosea sp.]|uniref:DUF1254 domain-containing protein n=1 Tax=Bosea sp. (in: a-proteobacteria) TaxID=1871050 RepID=UPI001AC86B9D|nr:hypothetical protein [Bosea sp. (in: a-proteobacteria)]MBN9450761.1 hypothetical protein [Bosea sp. (in: a-proteobacteria)]
MSAVNHEPPAERSSPFTGWRPSLRAGSARFVMTTLAGLVLAAIVHIITILAIPALSQRDAAHAYRELGTEGHAEPIPAPGNIRGLPALREADPNVVTAICSYDLSAGPMRIVARTGSLPLGLTLHRQGGGVLYAITDRAAIRGTLEFLVMTEAQRDERIAADEEGETSRELRIVSDTEQGLIVARVLLRLPSDRADAEALATGVACGLAN